LGDPRNIAGLARYGIQARKAFGVSAPNLRRLARDIGRNHRLALALWKTGIHDARHLAAMIAEKEKVTPAQMERWARDFDSWDVVDGCCCHLFVYTPHAWSKAVAWCRREEEFVRRAGFALMAYLAVHDKAAADKNFLLLLSVIERTAHDERNFVKKAVNWALRQIGKRNVRLNRAAIACAQRIRQQEFRAARWIAADALRELESAAVQRRLRGK
jgi:3-methyladenine DNA glycosylase AlkD